MKEVTVLQHNLLDCCAGRGCFSFRYNSFFIISSAVSVAVHIVVIFCLLPVRSEPWQTSIEPGLIFIADSSEKSLATSALAIPEHFPPLRPTPRQTFTYHSQQTDIMQKQDVKQTESKKNAVSGVTEKLVEVLPASASQIMPPFSSPYALQKLARHYSQSVWHVTDRYLSEAESPVQELMFHLDGVEYQPVMNSVTSMLELKSFALLLPPPLPGQTGLKIVISGDEPAHQISIFPLFNKIHK